MHRRAVPAPGEARSHPPPPSARTEPAHVTTTDPPPARRRPRCGRPGPHPRGRRRRTHPCRPVPGGCPRRGQRGHRHPALRLLLVPEHHPRLGPGHRPGRPVQPRPRPAPGPHRRPGAQGQSQRPCGRREDRLPGLLRPHLQQPLPGLHRPQLLRLRLLAVRRQAGVLGRLRRRGPHPRPQSDRDRRRPPQRREGLRHGVLPSRRVRRPTPVGARLRAEVRQPLPGRRQARPGRPVLRLRRLVHQPGDRRRRFGPCRPGPRPDAVHQGAGRDRVHVVRRHDRVRIGQLAERPDQRQRHLPPGRRQAHLRLDVPQLQLVVRRPGLLPHTGPGPRPGRVRALLRHRHRGQRLQHRRRLEHALPRRQAAHHLARPLPPRVDLEVRDRPGRLPGQGRPVLGRRQQRPLQHFHLRLLEGPGELRRRVHSGHRQALRHQLLLRRGRLLQCGRHQGRHQRLEQPLAPGRPAHLPLAGGVDR